MIEQDTIKLLRECDAGVKMGVASIDDVAVNNDNIAGQSVFGTFYGKTYDSVYKLINKMIDEGVPIHIGNNGEYGEYQWSVNRHSYGPYAEVSVTNTLTGESVTKSINTTNPTPSDAVKSLIRHDALDRTTNMIIKACFFVILC